MSRGGWQARSWGSGEVCGIALGQDGQAISKGLSGVGFEVT